MECLKIEIPSSKKEIQYALETALILGFQSETAIFPIASPEGTADVPKTEEELSGLWKLEGEQPPNGYLPAEKKGPVFELDFRKEKGLEYVFSRGLF